MEVTLVEVTLVNSAVLAPVAPIGVLLMVDPVARVNRLETMASVTELAGRDRLPETNKLVVVALVEVTLARLVMPEIYRLVEVTLEPAAPLTTKAPLAKKLVVVMLLPAVPLRLSRPLVYRLVVVTLVVEMLAGEKLVAAKLVKKPFVEVILVPLALPNDNRPETLALVPVALVKVRPPRLVIPLT